MCVLAIVACLRWSRECSNHGGRFVVVIAFKHASIYCLHYLFQCGSDKLVWITMERYSFPILSGCLALRQHFIAHVRVLQMAPVTYSLSRQVALVANLTRLALSEKASTRDKLHCTIYVSSKERRTNVLGRKLVFIWLPLSRV
jgi:uncharacterized membrane protein